jgi:hypothetical protein
MIIEICPHEPRATACTQDPQDVAALMDCTRPGDVQEACEFVLNQVDVEFHIIARNSEGAYENRPATAEEKEATARAIYFDSDADFSDESIAEMYLVWEASAEFAQ